MKNWLLFVTELSFGEGATFTLTLARRLCPLSVESYKFLRKEMIKCHTHKL